MKKRLRKKLHVREFKEIGFQVRFSLAQDLDEQGVYGLIDEFLNAIQTKGLSFGGGGFHEWEGFVMLQERGCATEEHRTLVQDWLNDQPRVLENHVGALEDAWHGSKAS